MQKTIVVALLLASLSVCAETITVLDTTIQRGYYQTNSNAKFFMDTETGLGYANITVSEFVRYPGQTRCNPWGCFPGGSLPTDRTIFATRVEIPNLILIDKQMIYRGQTEDINCGYLGESRVLKRPTLYLSGKCSLRESIRGNRLLVNFQAK